MTLPRINFGRDVLIARLEQLRSRAIHVSQDYDQIMNRTSQLELNQKHRNELADYENQLMGVIELFMQDDVRASTVVDYVIVFFRLVLAKLRQRGHDFDDVKQLHKALSEDDVAQTFRMMCRHSKRVKSDGRLKAIAQSLRAGEVLKTVLSKLAFPAAEQRAIRTVLEALQHHKWPTAQVMTTSPGGDAQISSALLYLRLQQSLDPVTNSALQRALCAAHECILTDMAVSKTFDVNLNACDVRKSDDAYVDARVKYRDYGRLGSFVSGVAREESEKGPATGSTVDSGTAKAGEDSKPLEDSTSCGDSHCADTGATVSDSTPTNQNSEDKDGSVENDFNNRSVPCTASGQNVTPAQDKESWLMGGSQLDRISSPRDKTCTQQSLDDKESPTDPIDHARFTPDTKFYVICYDEKVPGSHNPSASGEVDGEVFDNKEDDSETYRCGRRQSVQPVISERSAAGQNKTTECETDAGTSV